VTQGDLKGVKKDFSSRVQGMTDLSMRMEENKEKVAPKVEMLRGSQSSGLSKSSHGTRWPCTMVRSMIRGKFSQTGSSEMVGIDFVSKGATNWVDWRTDMVENLIVKIEPPPGGRSTFLAKREC
jgi:hypothetical protein